MTIHEMRARAMIAAGLANIDFIIGDGVFFCPDIDYGQGIRLALVLRISIQFPGLGRCCVTGKREIEFEQESCTDKDDVLGKKMLHAILIAASEMFPSQGQQNHR